MQLGVGGVGVLSFSHAPSQLTEPFAVKTQRQSPLRTCAGNFCRGACTDRFHSEGEGLTLVLCREKGEEEKTEKTCEQAPLQSYAAYSTQLCEVWLNAPLCAGIKAYFSARVQFSTLCLRRLRSEERRCGENKPLSTNVLFSLA